ncbi:LuxR family transcriptional regulator [Rhizobium sp. RU20A]|uniref:helix-turn-helix transcriptional regulator n=1 Tax=Rhizobium sp. RU20A TaxID=1907412 RepID=UPI000955069D|nr:autoinducer binding domain-containing protein [Rhizobium sp. RU20A]SIR40686.1 LuxR family transcriptional regulator [Rhizobium sp. RU20A]
MNLALLMQVLPLIDDIRKPEELAAEVERLMDRYGFDFYGLFDSTPLSAGTVQPMLDGRWPRGWMELYMQRKYMLVDPMVRYLGRAPKGYRWQEAINAFSNDPHRKRIERMITEARLHGLKEGFNFPVHSRTGLVGLLSLGGRPVSLTAVEMALFEGLAKKLFWKLRAMQVHETDESAAPLTHIAMTRRELEVLQHLAAGMTSNEISRTLGLSPHTIDWYMNGLQDKLQARNRHHVIAVAFRLGLIS